MVHLSKFKSVSVSIKTYRKLEFLGKGKFIEATLTIKQKYRNIGIMGGKKNIVMKDKDQKNFAR